MVGTAAGSEVTLRIAGAALAILGLAVSGYVTIAEAAGGSAVCIAGSTGCATVAESEYANVLGINVSVIGIGGYLALLATAIIAGDAGRAGGLLFGTIGFGFSAYLTYLELFVINAICQWCVASAVIMTAIFAINAYRAIRFTGRPPEPRPNMGAST